jgi:hypothetical protein
MGAPPPDQALPVPGETNLFTAQLWFMESGAHGVEIGLRGSAGQGRVIIPFNSVATRVTALPSGLGVLLGVLGLTLLGLLSGIVGAAVRESVLPPGASPARGRRWGARAAMALTALGLITLLWGGWEWWEAEAAEYRHNRLYRSQPTEAHVDTNGARARLRLTLEEPDPRQVSPLVPDHGRIMHLFLLREPALDAFAHLHPVRVNRKTFDTPLPPLPAGEYTLYAQVTHETGFARTLTNRVAIPALASTAAGMLDPEDAWWAPEAHATADIGQPGGRYPLGPDLVIELRSEDLVLKREPVSLDFRVTRADGATVILEPYLGMQGHLVVRSLDGRAFAHVHPSGSFSMAAQQLFELRDAGKAPWRVEFGANDPACRLPGLEESTAAWLAQKPQKADGTISFPYEFTQPGPHRLWVQVRVDGRVRTGLFELTVGEHRRAGRG